MGKRRYASFLKKFIGRVLMGKMLSGAAARTGSYIQNKGKINEKLEKKDVR